MCDIKNILSYYYDIHPLNINKTSDDYFFTIDNTLYILKKVSRPFSDIEVLYNIDQEMINNGILMHEIINNNDSKAVTQINNKPYVLLKTQFNVHGKILENDIYLINFKTINIKADSVLNRENWALLWESKNDFFESQSYELGSKYKVVNGYLNYYIGLAENAITYVKNIDTKNSIIRRCMCHKRIHANETLFSLYDPLNLINDYFVRDICEYIKSTFFINKEKAFQLLINFFNTFNLTREEVMLFYGRLIYPSYFFDIYDDIVNGIKKEEDIENIILQSSSYEQFLTNVHSYITRNTNYQIPVLDWLVIPNQYFAH